MAVVSTWMEVRQIDTPEWNEPCSTPISGWFWHLRFRGNLISWEPGHHPGNLLVILWRNMHELPFMNGNILLKVISYCREISKESSQQATSLIWNGNTSHDRTRSCICYVSCLFEFNDNWSNIHIRGIDTMRFWYPNGWAPIILKVFRTPKLEGRWCRVKTNLSFNSGIDWYKCVVLI